VIVAENFGGGASDLDGKDADTFDAAITSAGGSATWVASPVFDRDGAVTNSAGNRSAHLDLGDYINDHKGDVNGWFALTMTISEVTGDNNNDLIALGFSSKDTAAPDIESDFTVQSGVATIAYRRSKTIDMWAGPGTDNPVGGPAGNSGARTLTATLDLTPDGGYDGASNYGTVTWSDSVLGPLGNHTYTEPTVFNYLLISSRSLANGTNSNLTLEQFSANHLKAQNPSGDVFVRNGGEADNNYNNHELQVGRVGNNDWCRGLMQFDLSSIPDTATIVGATLDLFVDSKDGDSITAITRDLTVQHLTNDFTEAATYNTYDGSSNWATPGGDFDSTILSSFEFSEADGTSPDAVSTGDQFTFTSSPAFASAVQSNLEDDLIGLIVRLPDLEVNSSTPYLFRFASSENSNASHRPVLTVRYSWIPRGTVVSIN